MKIEQKDIDKLNAILEVTITPKDYQNKVEKQLKDYRKNAVIPGFRKGKTPMSFINKKYRVPVLIDEVNKIIQNEIYQYIHKEKKKILGSPIPVKDNNINWETDTTFKFKFSIGISPDIKINITDKDKLDYYKIEADNKLIDNYSNDIAKRYGTMSSPKVSVEGDLVLCEILQLDANGEAMSNGIKNEATVAMDFISDNKIKKKFIGVKNSDVLKVNVKKAFSNKSDLASMLNIKVEQLEALESEEFQFTVKNISRLKPASINKDLFDKLYGKDTVKTKKEFRKKIKDEAERSFVHESDRMLKNDIVNYLIENIKFDLPDDFLKNWIVHSSENDITLEKVELEYDMYSKSLKWQLIESKILQTYDIKVSEEEVQNHAKSLIAMQMQQYNQSVPESEKMDEIVNNVLQKEEEKKKVFEQLYDIKTLKVYKEKFKLKEKAISYDDFVKLASEK